MKKKLLCLVLALCVGALLCLPCMARDDGYVITDYKVDAVLHENNTVTQTETISVNFLEYRHGIFRKIAITN